MQPSTPNIHGSRARRRSRLEIMRENVHQLFNGRSSIGRKTSGQESPKPPGVSLGLGELPSTRIHIPYLTRLTASPSLNSSRPTTSPQVLSSTTNAPSNIRQVISTPQPVIPATNRPFVGVGPEEQYLADLAFRRKRHRRQARRARQLWFSKKRKRNTRFTALRCIISGLFLLVVLTTYLALALSNTEESQEFHVFLILTILVCTIFFCHALIRLCLTSVRSPHQYDQRRNLTEMVGPGGYANPAEPIPVTLARDEEAVGIQSEATKYPPPAYGLWRESVRVDPNRLFWQRNESASGQHRSQQSEGSVTALNRPPSYISDDGVGYVLEAAPRSLITTQEMPLPVHPAEMRAEDRSTDRGALRPRS